MEALEVLFFLGIRVGLAYCVGLMGKKRKIGFATKKYNYISSYTPTAGDRTAVLKYGGTMLVIGKLAI